jgi:WhiB family redox-sensing transcriptional regulator
MARLRRDRAAKAICAGCPVKAECADYAIRAREPYGVWGGLTEEEREALYARIPASTGPRVSHASDLTSKPTPFGQAG